MAKRKHSSKRSKKKSSSFISKFIKYFILIILLILILGYLSFKGWNSKLNGFIEENLIIVNTSMGPIEYMSQGEGPIILLSHMEGSGADNLQIFSDLISAGYQIICPSRPGYLHTPINKDANFKYQAGMFAELLQHLDIQQKVVVIGLSAGGPAAIEFASKYADKTAALILVNAASGPIDQETELSHFLKFKQVPLLNPASDMVSWINYYFAKYNSKDQLKAIITNGMAASPEVKINKANELIADPKAREDLLEVLKYSNPASKRIAGLKNDIKNLTNFQKPSIRTRIPKLVIHSKLNGLIGIEHANNFKNSSTNCELFAYEGYGHAFWLNQDLAPINAKIISFLKNKKSTQTAEKPVQLNTLTGITWVNNSDGALLHIKNDGSFNLDFPSVDTQRYYQGKFSIVDNQISFTYNNDVESCSGISGVYKFEVSEDKLELKALNDKCSQRKQHFSQGWFRFE